MKQIKREIPFAELMPIIRDSFEQGLTVTLPVTGNSMKPLFSHKRDSVVLSACDPYSLKRGDVPLYRRDDGQYVLHRIVRVEEDTYTLTGDAQWELEIGLPKKNVLAVMTGFIRKGKAVNCQNFSYRVYVAVWMCLRPLRPMMVRVRRKLRSILKNKK
ncbi:MAG: S24/S26 family peptidase [Clostridia bacterium]|nr:S24/S26 family peptidase [Clostridia bacterium]